MIMNASRKARRTQCGFSQGWRRWAGALVLAGAAAQPVWALNAAPASSKSDATASTQASELIGTTKTIWSVRRRDGSLVLRDTPPPAGVAAHSYVYRAGRPDDAQRRVERERDYWRRQGEAFEQRRMSRLELEARVRQAELQARRVAHDGRRWVEAGEAGWWGWPVVVGARPSHPVRVESVYATSPGAVQGRGAPFVNAGFGAAQYR
jgi:hypothetical protein